jgi:hypothetical protein
VSRNTHNIQSDVLQSADCFTLRQLRRLISVAAPISNCVDPNQPQHMPEPRIQLGHVGFVKPIEVADVLQREFQEYGAKRLECRRGRGELVLAYRAAEAVLDTSRWVVSATTQGTLVRALALWVLPPSK